MASMHNERIKRDRMPFVFAIIFLFIIIVSIITFKKTFGISYRASLIIDSLIIIAFLLVTYRIHISSKTQYKYSLISDELLVNKLVDNNINLVNRIKLDDVSEIKKVDSIFERIKSIKHDLTCPVKSNVYKLTHTNGELYFMPSDSMINKIEAMTGIKSE